MKKVMLMVRLLAVAAVAVLGGSGGAGADQLALTFTGGGLASEIQPGGDMAGWRFDVTEDIVINGLGIWDYEGDGLASSHEVGIWTDAGVLVASTTVAAGTVDPIESGFRIATIGNVQLEAGTRYRIAAYYADMSDQLVVFGGIVTTAPQITYINRAFALDTGGFTFPTDFNSVGLGANFGPTFRIASSSVVPEPATLAMAAGPLLLLGLFAVRRQTRTRA